MKLRITTPTALVVEADEVRHVRAEDETGAFGILDGHADFLTVLATSVLTWRDAAGREHHVAVRGGILVVQDGHLVEVATRDAVGEETLARLGPAVLQRLEADAAAEDLARASAARLHATALRQLQRYLQAGQAAPDMSVRAGD